ncbi:MAG: THUMP domain-containing protein [Gammaproteobacteria bacterium]
MVVTVRAGGYSRARRLLEDFGALGRTEYFNVLVMRISDRQLFMDVLQARLGDDPAILDYLARVVPVEETFLFQHREDFEDQARRVAERWLPVLAGRSFHVRMHRRGFKGRLSSQEEERILDAALMEALTARGTPATVSFQDPDAIIAIETVGQRAGLSLFTREELQRYTLLDID